MSKDSIIDYGHLIDKAMHYVVRNVLEEVLENGVPGDHHFFITFKTTAKGVMIDDGLIKKYPEEMTIVLQHQFYDLEVNNDNFSVVLSFDHVRHNLTIPYSSLVSFVDPSVRFGLQFNVPDAPEDEQEVEKEQKIVEKSEKKVDKKDSDKKSGKKVSKKGESNVVTLDSFRKNKGNKKGK